VSDTGTLRVLKCPCFIGFQCLHILHVEEVQLYLANSILKRKISKKKQNEANFILFISKCPWTWAVLTILWVLFLVLS
jgi:hypothetical protein